MMLTQFRMRYPQGSLISELITIDHGKYIVRVLIQVGTVTLATGLAAASSIEEAEDRARDRALAVVPLDNIPVTSLEVKITPSTTQVSPELSQEPEPEATPSNTLVPEVRVVEPKQPAKVIAKGALSAIAQSEPLILTTEEESPKPSSSAKKARSSTKVAKAAVADEMPWDSLVIPEQPLETSISSVEQAQLSEVTPEPIPDKPLPIPEVTPEPIPEKPLPIAETPVKQATPSTSEQDLAESQPDGQALDFSEIIARSDVEMKRLGWTKAQGRDYLVQTYGKRSRQVLSDAELLEFLYYLESQPTP